MEQKEIIDQFPILKRQINGKRLVYLDNAATTQKPDRVIRALRQYYEEHNANIHRGLHTLSNEATELYEGAHEKCAKFINANNMQEVIFTRNTTESINLVAYAWGRKFLKKGDVVVITGMEHHSNIVPWQMLVKELGIRLEWVPVIDEGEGKGHLDMEELKRIISVNSNHIKLVSIVHVSNVLGTVNPIKDIIDITHNAGAIAMIDAAQSAARIKLDVKALDVDFLAFSSHKMYGPTGIGVLYGKKDLLESMNPWMCGGDMIRRVSRDDYSLNELPWKFEAGTPNIADGSVLSEAIDFIEEVGFDYIQKHEKDLISYAYDNLADIDDITIFGPGGSDRLGVISFYLNGVHAHDLATLLNEDGVAVRAGHHCAMPLHLQFGIAATARISFAVYNTRDDVDVFIKSLKDAKKRFI
ncbi:cysteine desulfurase [Candidatus Dojkabacteria bacterium]|nr:cysteine desulfurase [Candidatus Dojkabacteria bacterium]